MGGLRTLAFQGTLTRHAGDLAKGPTGNGMAAPRSLAWAALAVIALVLAGCLYSETVIVSGPPEQPVLTVKPSARGPLSTRVIGLDRLEVYDTETTVSHDLPPPEQFRQKAAWAIYRDPSCGGAPKRVEYGVIPAGYRELVPAKPLVANRVYSVVVGGCGLVGGARFKISGGRLLFAAQGKEFD